jgi:hypothetical protein
MLPDDCARTSGAKLHSHRLLAAFLCHAPRLQSTVGIEFELCKLILSGGTSGPLVVEGRQPGVMEAYCRSRLGRGASFNLRLTCSVREQALRFIEREVREADAAHPRTQWASSASPAFRSGMCGLHQAACVAVFPSVLLVILRQSGLEMLALASGALPSHLRQLRDAAPFLRTIVHPDVERICALFDDNDGRDEDDRRRFSALYGADPILDYRVRTAARCALVRDGCARLAWPLLPAHGPARGLCGHVLLSRGTLRPLTRWPLAVALDACLFLCAQNPSLYDCIIDTTRNQSRDTFRQAVEELSKRCTLPSQSKL